MRYNLNSSMISLYDMVAPSAPSYTMTRNAIELHREGYRPAVAIPLEANGVVV